MSEIIKAMNSNSKKEDIIDKKGGKHQTLL